MIEAGIEPVKIVLEEMRVDVQRHRRRAVPQLLGDGHNAGPLSDQQRGAGMAQVVRSQILGEMGEPESRSPHASAEVRPSERLSTS
jgi:hypothetical protein